MQVKHQEALVRRADNVRTAVAVRPGQLTSREAALALQGVMSWIARAAGTDRMHATAGELATHDPAWSSSFRDLPLNGVGEPSEHVQLVAAVCRGLLEVTSAQNLRDALSFWASERSPENWRLA